MRKTLMTALAGLVGGTGAWAVSSTVAVADSDYDDDYEVSGPVGWAPWAGWEYDRPLQTASADRCCVRREVAEPAPPPPPPPVREAEVLEEEVEPQELALILFDFDSANIDEDAVGDVEMVGAKEWIDEHPDAFLVIEGHTDQVGTEAYNAGLAARRAENVRSAMLDMGADPDRLVVGVYGEQDPISINDAENRRVVVRGTDDSLEEITQAALDKGLAVVWAYEPSAEAVAEREEQEPENRDREL